MDRVHRIVEDWLLWFLDVRVSSESAQPPQNSDMRVAPGTWAYQEEETAA